MVTSPCLLLHGKNRGTPSISSVRGPVSLPFPERVQVCSSFSTPVPNFTRAPSLSDTGLENDMVVRSTHCWTYRLAVKRTVAKGETDEERKGNVG